MSAKISFYALHRIGYKNIKESIIDDLNVTYGTIARIWIDGMLEKVNSALLLAESLRVKDGSESYMEAGIHSFKDGFYYTISAIVSGKVVASAIVPAVLKDDKTFTIESYVWSMFININTAVTLENDNWKKLVIPSTSVEKT